MLNYAEDALDQVTSGRDGDRGMRGLGQIDLRGRWKPVHHRTYLLAQGPCLSPLLPPFPNLISAWMFAERSVGQYPLFTP